MFGGYLWWDEVGNADSLPPPTVSGITPNHGPYTGGTAITDLAGTHFVDGATVTFNGVAATSVVFVSSTKLTCVSPAGTGGAANVVVTNPDGQASGNFTFTYDLPTITSLNHTLGDPLGQNSVVLAGTLFTGVTQVYFGATAAVSFVIDSAIQITAVAPAHVAGSAPVKVHCAGGDSNTSAYEYWDPTVPATPTAFLRGPNYTKVGAVGLWDTSIPLVFPNYTAGGNILAPAQDGNGRPQFAITLDRLQGPGTEWADLIDLSNATGFTIAVALDLGSLSGAANAVISSADFYGALYFESGPGTVSYAYYEVESSSYKFVTTTIPSSGRIILIIERDISGTPKLRIMKDGTTWVNGDNVQTLKSTFAGIFLGYNTAIAAYPIDATFLTVVTLRASWNTTDAGKFFQWVASTF